MTIINEISEVLKGTREASGVSKEEVSNDLNISVLVLEQLEEGNIGAFKDIFELKKYITDYSKYLGLNPTEVIDEFNEYMFEKTSKIPMSDIEEAAKEAAILEANDDRVASPYTREAPINSNKSFVITLVIVFILVVLAVIWSIKQITSGYIYPEVFNYIGR